MATTLTNANLTVTLSESVLLNGIEQGSTSTKTYSGINEVYKRIVTVTTTEATVLSFHASDIGVGQLVEANVRYMRFTNLDDTNFITLTFTNENNDEVALKLDAGQSFIFNADNSGGVVDVFNATENADANSDIALGDLTGVQADANTASCDLEIFVASV